jgi:ADP-ribose pyrophosphatase YjhB (NUDIX family)
MKFCAECGHSVTIKVPDGDHAPRHVCVACGTVHYRNPKVIVGCIPEWEDKVLMCRRSIQPRHGYWTFPAGFLELHETSAQGAAREALEESQATVDIGELFTVIDCPDVGQVYMIYRAKLREPKFGPTPESSEVVLMTEAEIPWDEIAFRTIWRSLKHFYEDRAAGVTGKVHVFDLVHRKP